jgi:hypothetical protein
MRIGPSNSARGLASRNGSRAGTTGAGSTHLDIGRCWSKFAVSEIGIERRRSSKALARIWLRSNTAEERERRRKGPRVGVGSEEHDTPDTPLLRVAVHQDTPPECCGAKRLGYISDWALHEPPEPFAIQSTRATQEQPPLPDQLGHAAAPRGLHHLATRPRSRVDDGGRARQQVGQPAPDAGSSVVAASARAHQHRPRRHRHRHRRADRRRVRQRAARRLDGQAQHRVRRWRPRSRDDDGP